MLDRSHSGVRCWTRQHLNTVEGRAPVITLSARECCYQLKIPLPGWLCLPLGRLFFLRMVKIAEGWETLDRLIVEAQRERQQAE